MAEDVAKRPLRTWLSDHSASTLGASLALLLAIATVVYHWLEDWSWVDSFYFSAVAVTTVGFGDLSPTTDGSKLFTVLYIGAGITAATTYLNHRFNRITERATRRRERRARRRTRKDRGLEPT